MSETSVLWEETVQPGAAWSHVLKRGTALRITDIEGGANVGALFYNFECPVERYNMPDTLKAQHIARLTKGFVLYSDMGRILCSITEDTVGWHDPLGGCSNAASGAREVRRGALSGVPQRLSQNARDSFLVELGKWGLGPRDLVAERELLQQGRRGGGRRHDVSCRAIRRPGSYVELRAEMNVLVILNTCQHPLDPNPKYAPKPVQLSIAARRRAGGRRSVPAFAAGKRARIHPDGAVFSV